MILSQVFVCWFGGFHLLLGLQLGKKKKGWMLNSSACVCWTSMPTPEMVTTEHPCPLLRWLQWEREKERDVNAIYMHTHTLCSNDSHWYMFPIYEIPQFKFGRGNLQIDLCPWLAKPRERERERERWNIIPGEDTNQINLLNVFSFVSPSHLRKDWSDLVECIRLSSHHCHHYCFAVHMHQCNSTITVS